MLAYRVGRSLLPLLGVVGVVRFNCERDAVIGPGQ